MLLDNGMFDDGTVACKNFQVVNITTEDTYCCEYDWLASNFSKHLDTILNAINKDVVSVSYVKVFGDDGIEYEVSWD
jgi:hypothetical protein